MKVALYNNTKYGFENVHEVSDALESSTEHVRISEVVGIEFKPLSSDEVVNAQIESLKSLKQELMAQSEIKIQAVDRQISELLALPNNSAEQE